MRYFLLIALILHTGSAMTRRADDLEAILKARYERLSRIKSLTCLYTNVSTPTDAFAIPVSRGMKVSVEQVKRDQGSDLSCRLDEVGPDRYRYSSARLGPDGRVVGRTTLAYDGKESWKVKVRPLDDQTDSTSAEFGGNYTPEVARQDVIGRLFGDSTLTATKPPFAGFLEADGVAVVGEESLDGNRCVVVRQESIVNRARTRKTAWLDRARQFLVLKFQVESYDEKRSRWFTFTMSTVRQVASTEAVGPDGVNFLYWYPREATHEIFNEKGDKTFEDIVKVQELILNRELTDVEFTPKFEDGSKIRDARTGRTTIYGGGPSPKLKRLVDSRVAESRERLKEFEALGPAGSMKPPSGWTASAPWAALAIGISGLVGALILRRKS